MQSAELLDAFDVPIPSVEDVDSEGTITQPFDPAKIRIETKQLSLDTLLARMQNGEIVLQPDFQRQEVWKDKARSRLIESILIRIPLPAFYMDATDDDKWLVVDGQQRLSTLERFVLAPEKERLHLQRLEFLNDFEGCTFEELPRAFQRRIRETNVTVYLIERGTPSAVKINIFKRINTGGLPLSPQEIRHALNGQPVAGMLKELAASVEFREATQQAVSSERMADREFVARFFAFLINPPEEYSEQEFDSFLSATMAAINKLTDEDRDRLKCRFRRAMRLCGEILGKTAFRKLYSLGPSERLRPVNKALFEAWSVNFDKLSDGEARTLKEREEDLRRRFVGLMNTRSFEESISQATGDTIKVKRRFESIARIIRETLS